MKNLKWIVLGVLAVFVATSLALAQAPSVSMDPCSNYARTSQPISAATAGTTRIINNATTNGSVYICALWLNSVGGTSTLEYGTGTACATAATATTMTGPLAAASTVSMGGGVGSLLIAPAGQSVCILAGASTTATAGFVSYVINGPM